MSAEVHGLSPTQIAGWIAEAGQLRAENERLRAKYEELDRVSEAELAACEKERDVLRAENERLREALAGCERVRDEWCMEYTKVRDAFYGVVSTGRLTLVSGSGDVGE